MPIDVAQALAAEPRSAGIAWGHKDVQLYHLGLTDPDEVRAVVRSRARPGPRGGGSATPRWPPVMWAAYVDASVARERQGRMIKAGVAVVVSALAVSLVVVLLVNARAD